MGNTSFLDEVVKQVGGNEGQPELPKPADIVAAEKGQVETPPPPPVAPAQAPSAETPAKPAEGQPAPAYDLDAIIAKAQTGEVLSDDEVAILRVTERSLAEETKPPEPAPKTFKIGGQEFTEAELWEKARDHFGLGGLDLSAAARANMVETYYKAQNKTEFSRATTQKAEQVAHDRKAIEEQARRQTEEALRIHAEQHQLALRKQELQTKLKALETALQSPITKEELTDPNTGTTDWDKLFEYQAKVTAQRQAPDIRADIEKLEQSERDAQQAILQAEVRGFIATHPQYRTTGDVLDLWTRHSRGEMIPPEDKLRVMELDDIFTTAAQRHVAPEDVYALRKAQGVLAVKDLAPANSQQPKPPAVELPPAKTLAESILAYRRKQQSASQALPTRGGQQPAPRPAGAITARQMIEVGRKVLGEDGGEFLRELGYKK